MEKIDLLEKYWDINVGWDWYECTIDDMKSQLEIAGFCDIKIQFSGFCRQGDGASFTAEWRQEWIEKTRFDGIYMQEIKDFLQAIKNKHLRYFHLNRTNSRYYHENSIYVDDRNFDIRQADFITNMVRDICCGIYRSLEQEYDYLTSESAILEALEANEITE